MLGCPMLAMALFRAEFISITGCLYIVKDYTIREAQEADLLAICRQVQREKNPWVDRSFREVTEVRNMFEFFVNTFVQRKTKPISLPRRVRRCGFVSLLPRP